MDELDLIAASLQRPTRRFSAAAPGRSKPEPLPQPDSQVSENIAAARTDAELKEILVENRNETVVVNYGSSFCHSCHNIFPHFYRLSTKYPGFKYVMAQIDYMHESVEGIEYTPTFRIIQHGKTVDQFYGASKVCLQDHLWLHADE